MSNPQTRSGVKMMCFVLSLSWGGGAIVVLFSLYGVFWVEFGILFTLVTLYTLLSTLFTVLGTLFTLFCTLDSLFTIFTLFTVFWRLNGFCGF